MLALYIPGNSVFHRANAGLKVAALAIFAIIGTATSSPLALAVLLVATLVCYRCARLPALAVSSALRPALPFLILLAGLESLMVSVESAAAASVRVADVILAAALVTYTTKTSDMIAGIAGAVKPLARLGLSPSKAGLALALTIRFIPSMMQEYREVQAARVARGGRRFSALALGPLILSAVRMADEVGDAVAARGFDERDHHEH